MGVKPWGRVKGVDLGEEVGVAGLGDGGVGALAGRSLRLGFAGVLVGPGLDLGGVVGVAEVLEAGELGEVDGVVAQAGFTGEVRGAAAEAVPGGGVEPGAGLGGLVAEPVGGVDAGPVAGVGDEVLFGGVAEVVPQAVDLDGVGGQEGDGAVAAGPELAGAAAQGGGAQGDLAEDGVAELGELGAALDADEDRDVVAEDVVGEDVGLGEALGAAEDAEDEVVEPVVRAEDELAAEGAGRSPLFWVAATFPEG